MRKRSLLLGSVLGLLAAMPLAAQDFPSRPIQLVVPFPAGPGVDAVGRALAKTLSAELKQPVVVVNRVGASGAIGAQSVAAAPPDGHTLLLATSSVLVFNNFLFAKLPYHPVTSFEPVARVALQPFMILAGPSMTAQSLPEFIQAAKAKPRAITFANTGASVLFTVHRFSRVAGVQLMAVPYKGSPPAVSDLLGGHIDVMFDPVSTMAPLASSGKARGLAVTTAGRSSISPGVPSAREAGLAGFEASTWYGIVAPAGTPREIVARLNREIDKALRAPEVTQVFAAQGIEAAPSSPSGFGEFIASELAKWGEVARDAGIKPE